MPINDRFLQARAAEHRQRLHSYLPFALPINLALSTGHVIQVPQQHLSLQALIDLELVGNPFIVGGVPTRWHVYQYLWRLHPRYTPRGGLLTRLYLSFLTGRLLWPAAIGMVRERIEQAYLDEPAGDADSAPAPALPQHCLYDDLCRLFLRDYGLSRAEVLQAPFPWLLQLLRSARLAAPDAELDVIDRSDALLAS